MFLCVCLCACVFMRRHGGGTAEGLEEVALRQSQQKPVRLTRLSVFCMCMCVYVHCAALTYQTLPLKLHFYVR